MAVIQPRFEPGFPRAAEAVWKGADKFVTPFMHLVWDFEVERQARVPAGSVVLAANHFSHLDPFVAAMALRRPIRYLGVDELFGRSRFFDGLTYYLGVIPMPRGKVPLRAMRTAVRHLELGGVVGVFPEGRRVAEWGESPPTQGAAWLAYRIGCPLVPMLIAGTGDVMGLHDLRVQRHPVRVVVGAPMHPRDFPDRATLTGAWFEWMNANMPAIDPASGG
jgi:1-acyl-sn-glycerol-3-phosphate acyltransferase